MFIYVSFPPWSYKKHFSPLPEHRMKLSFAPCHRVAISFEKRSPLHCQRAKAIPETPL